MQKRIRLALIACAIGACAGAASAEAPAKPIWSVSVESDDGFRLGSHAALAVHADGTALLAVEQERGEGNDTVARLLLVSVGADGRLLARSAPASEPQKYVRGAYLAPDRDGFALLTNREADLVIYRLEREGRVRATHRLRFSGEPMQEINGLAAGGTGTLLVYGGAFDGPHSPAMAMLDPGGRVLWSFVGKHPMPPGGVQTARLRRDGGNDAVVIDREKPSWERRSAEGAVLMRAALPKHWDCWEFLDAHRLVNLFYNWEARPEIQAPAKQWVLALIGPNGRFVPGHRAFDVGNRENASCTLATNEAGWVAIVLEPRKIALFDAALRPRAEIDLSPQGATKIEKLVVDAKGSVTALVDTRPLDQPGRRLLLLRLAPPAN